MTLSRRAATRRRFLTWASSLVALPWVARGTDPSRLTGQPPEPAGQKVKTRLILLGTGGGPSPKRDRSAPAQAILVGGRLYVVDCGDGVARQIVRAGLPLANLSAVFVTHQHSDHNADYGNLLMFAWVVGMNAPVEAYGPPPLEKMTALFLESQRYDIDTRIADEGRPPLAPLIRAREISRPGLVMEDERVKVTAALNHHPPVTPSFAYRFDTADRSIVISGDTNVSAEVIKLAKDADVLVHEVLYLPRVDVAAGTNPTAARIREHIIASHTSTLDVGKVAAAAGVKTLVLSHFVPGGDTTITDEMWLEDVRRHFRGRVVVGTDLMEI